MNKYLFIFFMALLAISSCKEEESQSDIDENLIQEYLSSHNITGAVRHETGVYYVIDSLGDGSGLYPNFSSTVRVHYRGYFVDDTDFDPGNFDDTPLNIPLLNAIDGWQIGMPFFERGSKGRMFIPSLYGYGSAGRPNIPPNSVLIFDIHLINVY